jgi:hypothetical protein
VEKARKSPLIKIPLLEGRTLPHDVVGVAGAGRVLMQPASAGTGVIAGGPVRAVVESAGISDVLTKTLGTRTPRNVVNAVMAGLKMLRNPEERLAQLGRSRGWPAEDIEGEAGAQRDRLRPRSVQPCAPRARRIRHVVEVEDTPAVRHDLPGAPHRRGVGEPVRC